MASYTIAAFEKIFEEIKGLGFFLSLLALLLSIITQIIKICTSSGVLWLNITLLSITTICFIFCIVASICKRKKDLKWIKALEIIFKWVKAIANFIPLLNTVYDICIATQVPVISIILTFFSILGWFFSVVMLILSMLINRYKNLISAGFQTDTKPLASVGNFFKKLFGGTVDEPDDISKEKKILDKHIDKKKEQKKKEKERKKQEKAAEKERKKQEKEKKKLEKKKGK